MKLEIGHGDITGEVVDAIVNAANSGLLGGGGVDGAIHRVGGPTILDECRALRASERYRRGLPTGRAVATTAGRLPARWVIHTVGPVYRGEDSDPAELRSCYTSSLAVADQLGAQSVAFPLISAGIYGWPKRDAVVQAIEAIRGAPTDVAVVRLVLFDAATAAIAREIADD